MKCTTPGNQALVRVTCNMPATVCLGILCSCKHHHFMNACDEHARAVIARNEGWRVVGLPRPEVEEAAARESGTSP